MPTYVSISIDFPHYAKVEHGYEIFHMPKWHKAKKRLPLIYMEIFWRILRPQK